MKHRSSSGKISRLFFPTIALIFFAFLANVNGSNADQGQGTESVLGSGSQFSYDSDLIVDGVLSIKSPSVLHAANIVMKDQAKIITNGNPLTIVANGNLKIEGTASIVGLSSSLLN